MLVCVMFFCAMICVALILFSLYSPIIQYKIQGRNTSKGRKSLNSLHVFTFGDMSISNRVPSTHSLHIIPILVLLWITACSVQ